MLFDSIRLAPQYLVPDAAEAEATDTNQLESFDSDGFTVGSGSSTNGTSATFVGWNWLAGGTAASNTDGTITSSVSANPTAGFSIVSYTGNGSSGATVGHGLSQAPNLLITKSRDEDRSWPVGSSALSGSVWGYHLYLDTGGAEVDVAAMFNDTAPSSSVFTLGDDTDINNDTYKMIAYCFHSVEGYSKVGSYTGNSSSDGTFVYTGFTPAMVFVKNIDAATNWILHDYKRPGYNLHDKSLRPDGAGAAESNNEVDLLSNGFKWRGDGYPSWDQASNQSGEDYLFYAVAASPFKTSNAR
jgi:hypothetical protein